MLKIMLFFAGDKNPHCLSSQNKDLIKRSQMKLKENNFNLKLYFTLQISVEKSYFFVHILTKACLLLLLLLNSESFFLLKKITKYNSKSIKTKK